MHERALYTAASNKFFPSLINLLGSLKTCYPNHPPIFVYDLGLSWIYKKELSRIPNIQVVSIPAFVPYWRSCYTWKTYIFAHPHARLNFYMDAGSQVLRPLDEIFEIIDRDEYICVRQDVPLEEITPKEYWYLFPGAQQFLEQLTMTAGLFGFKSGGAMTQSIHELFLAAKAGLCLGYSAGELWKNRGPNKTNLVRDCRIFRFDTTVCNLILRKNFGGTLILHDSNKYGGYKTPHDDPEQLIWNFRMNYNSLQYTQPHFLHARPSLGVWFNRLAISIFLLLKRSRSLLRTIVV